MNARLVFTLDADQPKSSGFGDLSYDFLSQQGVDERDELNPEQHEEIVKKLLIIKNRVAIANCSRVDSVETSLVPEPIPPTKMADYALGKLLIDVGLMERIYGCEGRTPRTSESRSV